MIFFLPALLFPNQCMNMHILWSLRTFGTYLCPPFLVQFNSYVISDKKQGRHKFININQLLRWCKGKYVIKTELVCRNILLNKNRVVTVRLLWSKDEISWKLEMRKIGKQAPRGESLRRERERKPAYFRVLRTCPLIETHL